MPALTRLVDGIAPPRLGRGFRFLLGSSWVSNLGDGIVLAAGPLLVASLTRDPRLIAAATLVQWAPFFIFGLYAGALADRMSRRALMLVGNAGRLAVTAVLILTVATDWIDIWLLLATLFVLGTIEAFVDSAAQTLLPMLVPKGDLGVANARFQFGWMGINRLAAPPIGAVLFTAGAVWPFVTQLVCLVFALGLLARVPLPHVPRTVEQHVLRDIVDGLRWSMTHPAMRALNIQIATFNLMYGAAWAVLVLYALEQLGLSDLGYGLLLGANAVGGVIGALTYGRLERMVPIADIMRYGLVLECLTYGVLGWTTSPYVAGGMLVLFGIHESYWGATASSVRQRAVPDELQGRVASVYVMFMFGGLVIGAAGGGWIAEHWGIAAPYWIAFVSASLVLALLWRELGRIAHADEEIRRTAEAAG